MDTTKLRLGEVIAGVSAVLLFLVMFLHWYGIKLNGNPFGIRVTGLESPGFSAWKVYSYTDLLLLLLIILALGMVFLSASQRSTALPISMNVLVAGFGGIMTLIVFYRVVINQPGPNDIVSVKFWAYIGVLLTAGIAGGAFLAMREEGASVGEASAGPQGATGAGAAPTTPPAAQPQPQAPPAAGAPAMPAQSPPPSQPPPSQPPPGAGPAPSA